jgi:hypothetical protein
LLIGPNAKPLVIGIEWRRHIRRDLQVAWGGSDWRDHAAEPIYGTARKPVDQAKTSWFFRRSRRRLSPNLSHRSQTKRCVASKRRAIRCRCPLRGEYHSPSYRTPAPREEMPAVRKLRACS